MKINMKLTGYQLKDGLKIEAANKFCGFGAVGSSTAMYATHLPKELVNTGKFTKEDVVFISVNGNRPGAIKITDPRFQRELAMIMLAGASVITDNSFHRNRSYNSGERDLAWYLQNMEYVETPHEHYSVWSKP